MHRRQPYLRPVPGQRLRSGSAGIPFTLRSGDPELCPERKARFRLFDLFDLRVVQDFDLFVVPYGVRLQADGAQLVAAVNERHLFAHARQIQPILC